MFFLLQNRSSGDKLFLQNFKKLISENSSWALNSPSREQLSQKPKRDGLFPSLEGMSPVS